MANLRDCMEDKRMKRIICFLLLGVVILTGIFALTNGEYVRNIALLVRRWNDWSQRCTSYWDTKIDKNRRYIGSGPFEDFVFQQGAYKGIAAAMAAAVDECILLKLGRVEPDAYSWLTEANSDLFYNISQRDDSWYNGLSANRKEAYDTGYFEGWMAITGESARFPNIWEWKYFAE
jgi:hypothetical protein